MYETVKSLAEKLTGIGRPSRPVLKSLVRTRKPHCRRFRDDGLVPNHSAWPLVLYKSAVRFPVEFDSAAVLEELFERNRWGETWRNGIYDYIHYHSRIHEVLGIAAGRAELHFGGRHGGRKVAVKAGDVIVIPAGVGHSCLSASDDFLVVGAYPPDGIYDECRDTIHHHDRAIKTVPKVPPPKTDPVYGVRGPLTTLWRRQPRGT